MNTATAVPRARHSDPLTSHAAARRVERFGDSHSARILHVLKTLNVNGMCAAEIGEASGLTVVQVDRRTIELERKGVIRVVQKDGRDVISNGMRCWEAV